MAGLLPGFCWIATVGPDYVSNPELDSYCYLEFAIER